MNNVELDKLQKVKTREEWDFHVGTHQWYLAKQPLIHYDPPPALWENAFVAFFHATMCRNEKFSVSKIFLVRISTMLAKNVFSEVEKHWVISTMTMYGKALRMD